MVLVVVLSLLTALAAAGSCYAQVSRLQQVTRVRGGHIQYQGNRGNVKSTTQGMCIALGIGHNQQMYDSAFVLCIRADGMHRVEMGELDVVQAITWNDKIYSLACRNNDLVFVSDISGGNLSSLEVLPKYKGWFPMSISCIDGAFAVNDNANGVYIWNDSTKDVRIIPYTSPSLGFSYYNCVFAVDTTVYVFDGTNEVYVIGPSAKKKLWTTDYGGMPSPYQNVSVIGDAVKWVGVDSTIASLSLKDQTISRVKVLPVCERCVSYVGAYGVLSIDPQGQRIGYDEDDTTKSIRKDRFVITYNGVRGTARDTVLLPNIVSIAGGVAWWNGAFYFTAEVRDVGAPLETTETIVYRYEEPTPTSSVGIEQHATPSQRLHPAYSRGDFITWLSHLEGTVEVCDTFGSTIDSRDVHPGCVVVRNENTTWVVMVLPE